MTGTWSTIEVDKAIELGYKLLSVEEVWHFDKKSDKPFTEFIYALYKGKLEASGYPRNVKTEQDKERYIEEIKRKEGIQLDKVNINYNAGMRQMCKILLNSFWVRLSVFC